MRRAPIEGLLFVPNDMGFTKVARVSLLRRALLAGRKAGIQRWLVLAWCNAQKVQHSLSSANGLKDVSWQVYDIQKTSPVEVLEALQADQVMVVSCTAVFDYRALLQLQPEEGASLCITTDRLVSTDANAEAVILQAGRVVVTPTTSQPASYATGMLRCPGDLLVRLLPEVWQALLQSTNPVSILRHRLLDATRVTPVDISPYPWIPLTPPLETSVATAEDELIRNLGREGDSPLVRLIDRHISKTLTKRLIRTRMTPNHITLLSALIGVSGAILLAQPVWLCQMLGSVLFLLSTIIDGCDGEVARLTFQESDFGAKLDVIMDNVVHISLFSGIALGLYRQDDQSLYLVLGGLTLGGVLVSMLMYLPHLWSSPGTRNAHMRLHESFASRDFAYILPFLAWFGKLNWFLWAAAIGTYVFALALGGIYLFHGWQRSRRQSRERNALP